MARGIASTTNTVVQSFFRDIQYLGIKWLGWDLSCIVEGSIGGIGPILPKWTVLQINDIGV